MAAPTHSRRTFLATAAAATAGLAAGPSAGKPIPVESEELTALTLRRAGELLRSKAATPVDLAQACLARIERYDRSLHAFITVTREQALEAAREMQAEQQRGEWRGPLHGIPVALKDNIDTAGVRTTAASELFKDRVPTEDAEVVRRLKGAGAILLGKLNLHEFAYGGTSDVSYFGAVRNPWAMDHVSGGSSGGSAVAIAADFCYGTLGTDTGGSIRIPSSYCGTVGLKPTYGRVSNRGVIPLSWTLDHVGPICKTAEDAGLMLGAIAGYDAMDPASADVTAPDYARAFAMDTAGLRLGIPRTPFYDNLDGEVGRAAETAIGVLRKMCRSVTEPAFPRMSELFVPIVGSEAYAYHAKWVAESPEKYQAMTRERIIQLGGDVKAGVYAEALRRTYLLRREIVKTFADVDLLITPTMPGTAETMADSRDFEKHNGLQNTSPFDITGLPTISVPCGFTSAGLPIGMQISGAPWAETTVLALAHAYERATEWRKKRPRLAA